MNNGFLRINMLLPCCYQAGYLHPLNVATHIATAAKVIMPLITGQEKGKTENFFKKEGKEFLIPDKWP
jgi:hypothetical protein